MTTPTGEGPFTHTFVGGEEIDPAAERRAYEAAVAKADELAARAADLAESAPLAAIGFAAAAIARLEVAKAEAQYPMRDTIDLTQWTFDRELTPRELDLDRETIGRRIGDDPVSPERAASEGEIR